MRVWVSRDNTEFGYVGMFKRKPNNKDGEWIANKFFDSITWYRGEGLADEFKRNFKFTPRKGSCEEYDLELRKVK